MTITLNVSVVSSSYSNVRRQEQSALPASSEASRTQSVDDAVNNAKATHSSHSSAGFSASGSMLAPGADADKLPNCGVSLPLDGKQLPPLSANRPTQIMTEHQSAGTSLNDSPANPGLSTKPPRSPATPDQSQLSTPSPDAVPLNSTGPSLEVSFAGTMLAPGTEYDEQHDCGVALPVNENQSTQVTDPASREDSVETSETQQPLTPEIPETVIRAEYYQPQVQLDENTRIDGLVKVSLPDLFELIERNSVDWQYADISFTAIDVLG